MQTATATMETPAMETPLMETPAKETPAMETPAMETATMETAPAMETPAMETPAMETPAMETPAMETPAKETPAMETPAMETATMETAPAMETPAMETATMETAPAMETPAMETAPAMETPAMETATMETAPAMETPAMETAPAMETTSMETTTDTACSMNGEGPSYWWRTSGSDLSRMLHEANYPEEAQRQFLDYYRDTLCPLLGNKPESNSLPAAVGWDGNPFEYSFEFKGSTKNPGVRFVLDLSELRPPNKDHPLSIANSEKVLETLAKQSPMFDDKWHRALARWFVYSNVSPSKQQALVAQVGYQTPTILGFDINARILELAPGMLPVMAKSYFPPCFVAADKGFGRFQALSLGIRQMPDIGYYPNILLALKTIEDYVQDHPQYENCGRGMATDFVKAGKARLKVYMRYWGNSFDEMWDYYTLGGRIPDLQDDKEKLRDLIDLASGCDYPADKIKEETPAEQRRRALFGQKPTSMYFSLSPDRPYPVPKLYFYPAFRAPNDQAIAQGLDAWLTKYGWHDGGRSLEERLENVFTYRKLDEKPGIFTFIGIGRKEDSKQDGLSLQVYVTPELYETPRF